MKREIVVTLLLTAGVIGAYWAVHDAETASPAATTAAVGTDRKAPGGGYNGPDPSTAALAATAGAVGVGGDGRRASARVNAAGGAARPSAPVQATLPADLPITGVIAQLKTAADRGDPQAACRLGRELHRCYTELGLDEPASDRPRPEIPATTMTRCAGVPPDMASNAWRYLLAAADAGSVPAMVQFAIWPGLSYNNPATHADGWAAYRDRRDAVLWRAIQSGEPVALMQAMMNTLHPDRLGDGSTPSVDAYHAAVLWTAFRLSVPPKTPRTGEESPVPPLSPALAAKAAQEGRELYLRYFAHSPHTFPPQGWNGIDPQNCGR